MTTSTITQDLRRIQADATVFYQRLRQFHWLVRGPQFFALHTKFEELYDRWAEFIDEVAERILQLKGQPVPTLAAALATASLKETPEAPAPAGMVRQLVDDLQALTGTFSKARSAADQAGDNATVNLLDGMADSMAKDIWMLEAYLDQ